MQFYNITSISNFYFPILLIKIIYLRNKIYFFLFSFFPIFSSTFPQPLSSPLHCPITTTAPPPCPPRHHYPLPTKIPPKQKPILKFKKKKKKTHSVKPKKSTPLQLRCPLLFFLFKLNPIWLHPTTPIHETQKTHSSNPLQRAHQPIPTHHHAQIKPRTQPSFGASLEREREM